MADLEGILAHRSLLLQGIWRAWSRARCKRRKSSMEDFEGRAQQKVET